MRNDVFVYMAGPITRNGDGSVELHVARALEAFFELIKAGYPAFCPQLTGGFPSAFTEVGYETWIQFDRAVIRRCTHMLMLPGWSNSKGACREHDLANELGIPVCYSFFVLDQLLRSTPPLVVVENSAKVSGDAS